MFITFEGLDCSGKSTQSKLLKNYLLKKGYLVTLVKDPGTTDFSETIRKLLLFSNNDINSFTEAFLYCAARNDLFEKIIKPKLQKNNIVISDRFYDSTIAYQGESIYNKKIITNEIISLNKIFIKFCKPNLTIFLDTSLEIIKKRLKLKILDNMESKKIKLFQKIKKKYINIAKKEKTRFYMINGDLSVKKIHSIIVKKTKDLLHV